MNREVKYYYDNKNEPIKQYIKTEHMKKQNMIYGKMLYMKWIGWETKQDMYIIKRVKIRRTLAKWPNNVL